MAWQKIARRIADDAVKCLWDAPGRRTLDYLRRGRGLVQGIIAEAKLGYIPGEPHEWKDIGGLKVPCGITIPWYADGALWGLKVRRAAGDIRYQQVSDGNIKGSLYLADRIQPGLPLFLTEGEFDALIAWQAGWGMVSAASIGGAGNRRLNPRWYGKLIGAPRILVRMDADAAGTGAASAVAALSSAVKAVQVPLGKDVNEFYTLAGREAVAAWIRMMVE